MTSHIRKIFRKTVIYTVGSIFNRLLPFLLLPLYTYYFTPEDYGIYSLVYSLWFFIVLVYLFGFESGFQKVFMETNDYLSRVKIYSSVMFVMMFISFFFSLIIYSFSEVISVILFSNSSAAYLIKLLSILLVVDSLSRFPMILLSCEQRSAAYTSVNAVAVTLNVILNIIFIVLLGMGIESVFLAYIFSYILVFISSVFLTRKYLRFEFSINITQKLFSVSFLFFLYGVFLILIDLADRFMLEYFRGTAEVGIYSASYRIGIVMNLVITGFKIAWMPFFMSLKDKQENREVYARIFKYFSYAGLTAFLVFSLLSDDLIKFRIGTFYLLNQNYWSGIDVIPYILAAYLFHGLFLNLTIASFLENKLGYLLISSGIGSFMNILFNLFLIPKYGMVGAAVSTLIAYIVMFVVLYILSQKIYYIPYDWLNILKAFLITLLLFFLGFYISSAEIISYFTSLIVDITLSLVLIVYLFRNNLKKYLLKV